MPRVRIPRTSQYRREMTYAKLLNCVRPRLRLATAFEGKLLKPGAVIDEAELWPAPEYPEIPLLLEYAGNDHTGHGHRRSNDIYLLWRYERERGWVELVRAVGPGAEWIEHLKPVALFELGRAAIPCDARRAGDITGRVLGALEVELEKLCAEDRHLVMTFVYQEFAARVLAYAA